MHICNIGILPTIKNTANHNAMMLQTIKDAATRIRKKYLPKIDEKIHRVKVKDSKMT